LIVFEIADSRKQFWDETGSDWLQHFISWNTKVQNLRQKVGKMRTKVRFSGQFCRHKQTWLILLLILMLILTLTLTLTLSELSRLSAQLKPKISDRREASVSIRQSPTDFFAKTAVTAKKG